MRRRRPNGRCGCLPSVLQKKLLYCLVSCQNHSHIPNTRHIQTAAKDSIATEADVDAQREAALAAKKFPEKHAKVLPEKVQEEQDWRHT